jgi:hypothetical protein
MARVLAIEPLSSLTEQEATLLASLLASPEMTKRDMDDLVVYVLQTLVRPDEIRHLNLTDDDVEEMERPVRTVAPRDPKIRVGSHVQNYSGSEWSRVVLRIQHEHARVDQETGHLIAPIGTSNELRFAIGLSVTDEHGEAI